MSAHKVKVHSRFHLLSKLIHLFDNFDSKMRNSKGLHYSICCNSRVAVSKHYMLGENGAALPNPLLMHYISNILRLGLRFQE